MGGKMSDIENIKVSKIIFLYENKELLKKNLSSKVPNSSNSNSVLESIVLLLLDERKKEECIEYQELMNIINEEQYCLDEPTAFVDIFCTIKAFIYRIYHDDIQSKKIINRLDEYLILEKTMHNERGKTMLKAI